MANLQSEILFIAKFGGLLASFFAYYFWIVKPMAIFNERQKQNKSDIEKLKSDSEELKEILTILKTQHESNMCKVKE
jgi:F0F1-type ATP synthase membrane subunit b/b'